MLAQIWNSQWFLQPMKTSTGASVRVVYPGVWTHGFGPDFRGAMLEIDGRLITGDVEVELDVRGWLEHGHDRNADFDQVVLQVVARDRGTDPMRRSDGAQVPRLVLTDFLRGPLDDFPSMVGLRPLGAIGFDSCAEDPAREQPELIRNVCQRAGDRRMQEKVASLSGDLAVSPPAQVLYARMLDALGFSRNRVPMAEVAARLPYAQLATRLTLSDPDERFWRSAALLLGTGGFLPLSPQDAAAGRLEPRQVGRLESLWREIGTPWHGLEVPASAWTLARLRPAAHPARRLLAGAGVLGPPGDGLVERLTAVLRDVEPRRALNRWLVEENPWLGRDQAHEMTVNVVIPFALAYGGKSNQQDVLDSAAELWQALPAGRGNAVTRTTLSQICGDAEVRVGSARAEQGLIHINRNGCSQMRCYECPIAHLALEWSSAVTEARPNS